MAIAFDPGIGFGKTLAHNLELLANLDTSPRARSSARGRRFAQVFPRKNDRIERDARSAGADDRVDRAPARTRREYFAGA